MNCLVTADWLIKNVNSLSNKAANQARSDAGGDPAAEEEGMNSVTLGLKGGSGREGVSWSCD